MSLLVLPCLVISQSGLYTPNNWPAGGIFGASIYPVHPHSTNPYLRNISGCMQYFNPILDLAAEVLNTVRIVNFLDRPSVDDALLDNLDALVSTARHHNLSVVLDLSTFRNKLLEAGVMPYNATLWRDFLATMGSRYSSATNLLVWSLAGEPHPPKGQNDPLRPTTKQLTDFYAEASAMLRAADPNQDHLISTGGLTHIDYDAGIDWKAILSLPHIQLASIHAYDTARNGTGRNGMLEMMPKVATFANSMGKPFVLEEFGFDQIAFRDTNFDPTLANSYERIFSAASSVKADGVLWWNLDQCNVAPYGHCHNRTAHQGSFAVNPNLPVTWNQLRRNQKGS